MIATTFQRLGRTPLRYLWPGLLIMLLGMLAIIAIVLAIPVQPIQPGEIDDGWIQVGNRTRLQYVDLADGVRCYRMRYSSNLSCVREVQP